MTEFNIERWGGWVQTDTKRHVPIIYFSPDNNLKNIYENNKGEPLQFQVIIQNSNSSYDGKVVDAHLFDSGNVPNTRPNFSQHTGWYVLALEAPYVIHTGMQNGSVVIHNIPRPPFSIQNIIPNVLKDIKSCNRNMMCMYIVIVIIMLLSIYIFSKKK